MAEQKLIPVDLIALVEDQANSSPIVLLHDRTLNKLLPIWIGEPEARAIAIVMNKISTPRPLTHVLLLNTIESMGGKLLRVVIDRVTNHTYFTSIYVTMDGKPIIVDSRPSDALALALAAHVPIFVEKSIMEIAGQANPFPGFTIQQDKGKLSPNDLKKIGSLLEKARQREQKASGVE